MCTLNQSFCQDMYEWSHQDLKGKPPSPLNWQNTYCPKYTNMTTCITEAWKTASHHPLWCMFYFTITNWCFYARQESLKTGVTYPFHFCCLQDPATPKAESCMAANLNLQNLGPLKAIEKKLWGVKIIHLLVLQKCSNNDPRLKFCAKTYEKLSASALPFSWTAEMVLWEIWRGNSLTWEGLDPTINLCYCIGWIYTHKEVTIM